MQPISNCVAFDTVGHGEGFSSSVQVACPSFDTDEGMAKLVTFETPDVTFETPDGHKVCRAHSPLPSALPVCGMAQADLGGLQVHCGLVVRSCTSHPGVLVCVLVCRWVGACVCGCVWHF